MKNWNIYVMCSQDFLLFLQWTLIEYDGVDSDEYVGDGVGGDDEDDDDDQVEDLDGIQENEIVRLGERMRIQWSGMETSNGENKILKKKNKEINIYISFLFFSAVLNLI